MTDRAVQPSVRRVWGLVGPDRGHAVAALAGSVLFTAAGMASPLLVAIAIDRGITGGNPQWIAAMAAALAVVTLVSAGATRAEARAAGRLANRVLTRLRGSLVAHLHSLDSTFFDDQPSGRLVARLTSDLQNVQQFFEGVLPLLVRASLSLVVAVAVMFSMSVRLAIVVNVVTLPLMVATAVYRRRVFAAEVESRERTADLLTHVNESLTGIRVIQAFSLEQHRRAQFREANEANYQARMRIARASTIYYPLVELAPAVAFAVVLWYGGNLAASGELALGTLVAFMLYIGHVFIPIQQLTEYAGVLQAAYASLSKVFGLLDAEPGLVDGPGSRIIAAGTGHVRVENVSFRYAPNQPDVLVDVSLEVPPGQRVALVGASGAGKSTVAKVIARSYDPTAGRVLVDGHDITEITLSSLRRHVAIVPQEGYLFDGTVAFNIGMARPGTTTADIVETCEAIGVHRILAALPDGLETEVGSRGAALSAGQRQAVALARAHLADPAVLILDEATSNLDPATELAVEQALRVVIAGRTALVIAHRPAAALRAERVVVLEDGRVAQDGTPTELMAQGGAFAAWLRAAENPVADVS